MNLISIFNLLITESALKMSEVRQRRVEGENEEKVETAGESDNVSINNF